MWWTLQLWFLPLQIMQVAFVMLPISLEKASKKTDYLVTLIKFPLPPTHHPPRMTYEKMTRCWKVYHPPTVEK